MRVEIITTGTELLLGTVTNTHPAWLGRELFALGLRVQRQVAVPDGQAIKAALAESLERADLVILTGGLGPTSDDLTRDFAAEAFGREMHLQDDILEKIQGFFRQRKIEPPASIKRQAQLPEGAVVLENNHGTAPGLILEGQSGTDLAGKATILLPGPPRELHPMWTASALPWLREWLGESGKMHQRVWRILGVGESRVEEMLEPKLLALGEPDTIEVGYCARSGEVDLRLVTADDSIFDQADRLIRDALGAAVYAEGEHTLEHTVIELAAEDGKKIATAESCTGGLVAKRLTDVAGSSAAFEYGWVTYANAAKTAELGVPETLLAEHGAVSEPVARAMAEGALERSGADVAVSLTGIAGPGGGTVEKPVGTVWLGLAVKGGETIAFTKQLAPHREAFRYMASQIALDMIRKALLAT